MTADAQEVPGASARVRAGARVLVADDDRLTRELLVPTLEAAGLLVTVCEDGQEAVDRVAHGGIDLALLDLMMPRLSGLEACRLIKSIAGDVFLPVVLLTVKTDTASRVEGLRIGADDYVCKPFEREELLARIDAMLRIKRLHDEVRKGRQELERLAIYDELTGLRAYRRLNEELDPLFAAASPTPTACIVGDIDDLGSENRDAGRDSGDRLLQAVASVLRSHVGDDHIVARFGGDEFLVVLRGAKLANAVVTAEELWALMPERVRRSTPVGNDGHGVTMSIGVACFPAPEIRGKESLLRAADEALQASKRQGGNRVNLYRGRGAIEVIAAGAPARHFVPTIIPPPDGSEEGRGVH